MVCDDFRGVTGRSKGIIRYFDPSPAPAALPAARADWSQADVFVQAAQLV
jgi:hypothetical protein